MAKKATSLHTIINELVDRTNTDTQRIRSLEQSQDSIENRLDSLESEMLRVGKSIMKSSRDIEDNLRRRDKAITETQNMIKEIIKQLKRLAPSEKIEELETMLEIYDPLKSNFMTKEEVENLIDRKLSRS